MKANAEPSVSAPAQQSIEGETRPPSKVGGLTIALIFLAALIVLIVANM